MIHICEVRDSSWIAHPLAPNERWLCARPAHLKTERFVPIQPRELLAPLEDLNKRLDTLSEQSDALSIRGTTHSNTCKCI